MGVIGFYEDVEELCHCWKNSDMNLRIFCHKARVKCLVFPKVDCYLVTQALLF